MNASTFPVIGLGIGLALRGALILGGPGGHVDAPTLPLLTLLIISEFGMFVTAIAGWLGIRNLLNHGFRPAGALIAVACGILTVDFLVQGIAFWPL